MPPSLRRRLLPLLVAGLALQGTGVSAGRALEDEARPTGTGLGEDELEGLRLARARIVINRGLEFLVSRLDPLEGTFLSSGHSEFHPSVAITALGCLAFMAGGSTADTGRYHQQIRRTIRWLIAHAEIRSCGCEQLPDGHEYAYFFQSGDDLSKMHGHGYATWALALAYGMCFDVESEHRRVELRETLERAIHCIEQSQSETGGWWYDPKRGTSHEGSVTITQLQALRAARDAGLRVDGGVIDRAVGYVRRSQIQTGPNRGGFLYMLGDRDTNTTYALTAAAISTLNQTGIYDSEAIDLGLQFMDEHNPILDVRAERFPWYGRLYATQAYWQYKSLRHFRRFYPELVRLLEREQGRDGSFSSSDYGEVYATSMAMLGLAVPLGWLPSFQR